MHYSDPKHKKEQILEVVIYKHNGGEFDLDSIQSCKYINPYVLKHFLEAYEYLLEDAIAKLNCEEWFLFKLKWIDVFNKRDITITSITNVSNSNNEFHRLH